MSDCHANGFDAQAVWGWNGNGPYKITNNYLEASTEVVGVRRRGSEHPELRAEDIEIRGTTSRVRWHGKVGRG